MSPDWAKFGAFSHLFGNIIDFIVCVGLFLNLISSIFLLVGANIQLPELVLTLIAITCFSTGK